MDRDLIRELDDELAAREEERNIGAALELVRELAAEPHPSHYHWARTVQRYNFYQERAAEIVERLDG